MRVHLVVRSNKWGDGLVADVASDIDTAVDDGACAMARLLSRFDIMRRAEEQASELRIAEGRLLWLLTGDGPPRTLKQIACELELEQSTANRQVNAAVRAGVVRRFRESGSHAWLFEASDEGAALYERSVGRHLDRVDDALAALPADERERLVSSFATFIDAYKEPPPPSPHGAPRAPGTP